MLDIHDLKKMAAIVEGIVSPEEKKLMSGSREDADGALREKVKGLMEADMGSATLTPLIKMADKKTLHPWQGKESDSEIAFNFENVMDAQELYDFMVNSGLLLPGEVRLYVSEHQVSVHFASSVLVNKPDVIQAAMIAYYDFVEDTDENDDAYESMVQIVDDLLVERVKISGAPKGKKGNPFHNKETGKFSGGASIDGEGGGSFSVGKTKLKYTGAKKSKKGDLVVNFGSTKHPCGRAARKKGKDIRCWDGKKGMGIRIAGVMGKRVKGEEISDDDLRGLLEAVDWVNANTQLIENALSEAKYFILVGKGSGSSEMEMIFGDYEKETVEFEKEEEQGKWKGLKIIVLPNDKQKTIDAKISKLNESEDMLGESIKRVKLPNALRTYAVVNAGTGKHVALVDAATFSSVGLGWIPDKLGAGEWLVFQPATMINGNPNIGKLWWSPIRITVTIDGSNGKRRALEKRAMSGDAKMAPKGYRKADNEDVMDDVRARIMAKFTDPKAAKDALMKDAKGHTPLQFRRYLARELERAKRGKSTAGAFPHKPNKDIISMISKLKAKYDSAYEKLDKKGFASDEKDDKMDAMHKKAITGKLIEDVDDVLVEAKGKEVFLSMSDQVDQNVKHKAGKHIKIDSDIYDWAVKKFGKGGNVTITKKQHALSVQEILIGKSKGSMGSRTITVRPFGEYAIVRDDQGGAGKGKILYFRFEGKHIIVKEDTNSSSQVESMKELINRLSEGKLSVPDMHQKKIALKTLKMNKVGASVMGGMDHNDAVGFLRKIGYQDSAIKKILKHAMHSDADIKEFMKR